MIVIAGALIVFCSVIGGFWLSGGNALNLMHVSEFVIIGGAGGGAHTTEEWYRPEGRDLALKRIFLTLLLMMKDSGR